MAHQGHDDTVSLELLQDNPASRFEPPKRWGLMKLKHLEMMLSQVAGFEEPKWALEQYATPVHFASRMLQVAVDSGDIVDRSVLDLGCGTGMLTAAAALMGAGAVTGVDADGDALRIARENLCRLEVEEGVELLQADVAQLAQQCRTTTTTAGGGGCWLFDTVVMNPPFGTKGAGHADTLFLQQALKLAPVVYSLHKTSTREFLVGKGCSSCGAEGAEVLAQLSYDLPATYKFHRKKSVTIDVDLIRFTSSTATSSDQEEDEDED